MESPHPAVQALTRRLLAHEAGERPDAEALADAAERAFDKLRLHLSKLLGTDGFRVLLRRAITLARAQFPWLEGVEAQSDGSLKGLAAAAAAAPARGGGSTAAHDAEAVEGITAVPDHFLGLLQAFIGQDLSLRLLRGVWPEVDALLHVDPDPDVDPDVGLSGDGLSGDGTSGGEGTGGE